VDRFGNQSGERPDLARSDAVAQEAVVAVKPRSRAWAVPVAAVAVTGLLAIDVARALDSRIADRALAFFAPTVVVAVAAALAVGRRIEGRRMALLIFTWLFVAVATDLDWDWPRSRIAATLAVLAFGLQAPTYAHMVLAYPVGRVRDRRERRAAPGEPLRCAP
jgi:hypothetical protein